MTKADIRSLMKDLQKKMQDDSDLSQIIENIDEISAAIGDMDDSPRIRIPYVNAIPLNSGTWK